MTMPNSPIAQQALEAARGLSEQITSLTDKVESLETSNTALIESNELLAKSDTRQKHWITAIGLIGCLVAAVVVGVIIALVKVDEANDKAVSAGDIATLVQQYLEQGCAQTNLDRARQKAIWDTLFEQQTKLNRAEGLSQSDAEKKALAVVLKRVQEAYPQRDCSKVKEGVVQNLPPGQTPSPTTSAKQ